MEPVCCEHCNAEYSSMQGLRYHLKKVHDIILPIKRRRPITEGYPCEMCSKVFAHRSALYHHERMAHGAPPRRPLDTGTHKCELCERRFVKRNGMRVHMVSAHGVAPRRRHYISVESKLRMGRRPSNVGKWKCPFPKSL